MKDESLSLICSILENEITTQIDYLIQDKTEEKNFNYLDDLVSALCDLYDYFSNQSKSQVFKDLTNNMKKELIEKVGYFKLHIIENN